MALAANMGGDADLQELEMLLAEALYPCCCLPPLPAESLLCSVEGSGDSEEVVPSPCPEGMKGISGNVSFPGICITYLVLPPPISCLAAHPIAPHLLFLI